jgi:hypothetical protein
VLVPSGGAPLPKASRARLIAMYDSLNELALLGPPNDRYTEVRAGSECVNVRGCVVFLDWRPDARLVAVFESQNTLALAGPPNEWCTKVRAACESTLSASKQPRKLHPAKRVVTVDLRSGRCFKPLLPPLESL